MSKLFTIAGTSTFEGVTTYRFATGKPGVRKAKLEWHGHTNVEFSELPRPMNKEDAISWLVTQGRSAVMPTNRRDRPVELTPEQQAEAARVAKRAADAARKRDKRAAERAARQVAMDANYLARRTGEPEVPVPEVTPDEDEDEVQAAAQPNTQEISVDELLRAVEGREANQPV